MYLTKEGASQAYDGRIRRFGLDLGTTKPGHVIWKVYQLGGLIGDRTIANPKVIVGNYGGEQASVSAGATAGGNWLYGGSNNRSSCRRPSSSRRAMPATTSPTALQRFPSP